MSTIAQTALHLDLSERRFRELVDEGVIPRAARGEYELDATRTIYIRHLREQAAGRNKPGALDPGQERALKDRAQRELAEFNLSVDRGEMVRIEEIGGQMEQAFGVVRTRLLALPGKFGGDLTPDQVARIETEIRDALEELHARGAESERADRLRARIARAFLVFKPPPRLSLIEWADTYRRVSGKNSAQPGQWRTAVQPAAMGPMLAVTQHDTFIVTVVAATQVLKSELLMNTAFYFIHLDPSPILFVQPSQKAAESFSKERFQPTVAETPVLRELIKAPKARGSENTITHKDYPGGSLDFVGSESPTDLASRPKRVILCDEINKYPPSAGKEGDPLLLAEERASTYKDVRRHKFVRVCSPTVKDACRITGEYEKSDRRQCFVACPHCEHEQTLAWAQVRWLKVLADGTETFDPPPNAEVVYHRAESAAITCKACGEPWTETERREALRALEHRSDYGWRQTARFTCCGVEQTPEIWDDEGRSLCAHCEQRSTFDGHAGFHVSKLLSARHRLADVVREFIQAGREPEALRKWTNTGLAETWEHQVGEGMDGSHLINRAEPYGPDDLPDAVRVITGFCDVQGDRLEVQLVGWGQDEEAWPFLYEIINLDPAQPEAWRELDQLRARVFTTAAGRKLRIAAFGVDVGGLNHSAQAVAYCRRRRGQRVFSTVGRHGKNPIWPLRSSRSKANDKIWLVGVDAAKDAIYARLKIEPLPHPGLIHFPMHESFGPDYFEQLTAERREVRRRLGQQVVLWVTPKGKRNEALDTFVGCLAVRKALPQRIERGLEYGVEMPVAVKTDGDGVISGAPLQPASPSSPVIVRSGERSARPGRPMASYSDPYL